MREVGAVVEHEAANDDIARRLIDRVEAQRGHGAALGPAAGHGRGQHGVLLVGLQIEPDMIGVGETVVGIGKIELPAQRLAVKIAAGVIYREPVVLRRIEPDRRQQQLAVLAGHFEFKHAVAVGDFRVARFAPALHGLPIGRTPEPGRGSSYGVQGDGSGDHCGKCDVFHENLRVKL
ncbi:hypothetical protein SDC9_136534 [bioreactor metagenome]|uniref:Uncharacterized protein n=1 Tax=bioreactor metagenome TaxID=1076179 RepID=A0A645DJI3_9ZZZZ